MKLCGRVGLRRAGLLRRKILLCSVLAHQVKSKTISAQQRDPVSAVNQATRQANEEAMEGAAAARARNQGSNIF